MQWKLILPEYTKLSTYFNTTGTIQLTVEEHGSFTTKQREISPEKQTDRQTDTHTSP